MSFYTRDQILNELSTMPIYEDEFDLIIELSEKLDGKLFVRILEEVLMGNISFLDFKKIFANSDYTELLGDRLKQEKILKSRVDMFHQFKERFMNTDKLRYEQNNIILEDVEASKKIYTEEVEKMRNDTIYSLFDTLHADPVIVQTAKLAMISHIKKYYNEMHIANIKCKLTRSQLYYTEEGVITMHQSMNEPLMSLGNSAKLYKAQNGFLVLDAYNLKYKEKISDNAWGYLTSSYLSNCYLTSAGSLTTRRFSITPQDVLNKILLCAEKEMIPLEVDRQILTKADLNFMMENGMSVDEMKKMKALSMFLKKQQITFEDGE